MTPLSTKTNFRQRMLRGLLAWTCHTTGLLAQGDATAPTEDQSAVFALLDEFDPLDTSKLPVVVVVFTLDGQRWERYGFLEYSDAKQFRVRYVDLGRDTVEVTKEKPHRAGVSFEPTDLRVAAARAIQRARERAENPDKHYYYLSPDEPMPPVVEMLFLARACARSGLLTEVNSLWEAMPQDYRSREGLTDRHGGHELASALDHRLALDFTDPRLSWTDLLARHDKWLALFPNHYFKERVIDRRDGIASLLEAQRRRLSVPRTGKPLPADLVFDLHDEFHAGVDALYFDASRVSCPEPQPPHGQRPTDRLIDLDLEAVPALIDALDDQSPTRTVVYSSRHGGAFHVESVAALAECTLVEISGRGQSGRGNAAAWREWYARAKQDGVRTLLEEGVAAMEPMAIKVFQRRWPKELDTILAAIRKHDPETAIAGLFPLLDGTPDAPVDARVLALCADFASRIKGWDQRLLLAERLLERGNAGGVAPVLASWQELVGQEPKVAPKQDDIEKYMEWMSQSTADDQMLGFLVRSGDLATWRAIAVQCDKAEVRGSLAAQLLEVPWTTARKQVKESEFLEVESAFRKCLTQLLADDAPSVPGARFRHAGRETALHEPRRADVAACILAANWPKEFTFDPARTGTVRHRQILELRGTPSPRPPAVAPPADETVEQALLRANRVERVTIDASATTLDDAAQERIRAVHGKALTAEGLVELVIATTAAAKNNEVICTCERTGEGDGTSLTIGFRPLDEGRTGSGGGGWDVRLMVTAGGVQLGSEGLVANSGTLERAEKLEGYTGRYLGAIRKGLDTEARTGVEITFALHFR